MEHIRGLSRKFELCLLAAMVCIGIARGAEPPGPRTVTGRILEACSCMVPCPCNFAQPPSPRGVCDFLAFFEFKRGDTEGVALAGLQLAIAGRGGAGAVILIDSKASDRERNALERIASWILSLEGTPAIATLMVPINIQFGDTGLSASAAGGTIQITAHALTGNDGKSSITVSRPWIFGRFPVTSTRKCLATNLRVRTKALSFEYAGTNANDAVFGFFPNEVK